MLGNNLIVIIIIRQVQSFAQFYKEKKLWFVRVARMAIPFLKKSSAGVIINMSSLAGRFGYENRNPYSTAK